MHIDIHGWTKEFKQGLRTRNKYYAVMGAAKNFYNGLFFSLTSRYPIGTNIFDREWDLLLVLDACRVDAMKEVASEYDFIRTVGSIWSVGSSSHEWACKTYTNDHLGIIRDTRLVSTNPLVLKTLRDRMYPPGNLYSVPVMCADWDVVGEYDFGEFRHIGEDSYGKYELPPSPETLTGSVIDAGRETDFERTVVHYMQPHIPHGAAAYAEERSPTNIEATPWKSLRAGDTTETEVWENYLDTLRMALDSIELLLENFDAEKVVITADHGELFGEYGAYGHPAGFPHPNLKKVPWVTASAEDERTFTPDVDVQNRETETSVEDQLRQLGYL